MKTLSILVALLSIYQTLSQGILDSIGPGQTTLSLTSVLDPRFEVDPIDSANQKAVEAALSQNLTFASPQTSTKTVAINIDWSNEINQNTLNCSMADMSKIAQDKEAMTVGKILTTTYSELTESTLVGICQEKGNSQKLSAFYQAMVNGHMTLYKGVAEVDVSTSIVNVVSFDAIGTRD